MDVKDVKTEKIMLPRKEVRVSITFDGATPARKSLRQSVADKIKAKADYVIIRHVYTKYGSKEAEVIAYVYDDENSIKSLEYEKMIAKNSDKKAEEKA